ncbi:MAG: hypothetical protein AB7O52_12130 [Planctomycetota bacterium]
MDTVFQVCAIVGGVIMVVQIVLMSLGFDHGDGGFADFQLDEAGIGGHEFFDYLSLKAIVAFLTFFGLGGLLLNALDWRPFPGSTVVGSLGAGLVAFYVVGIIMKSFQRLQARGNVSLANAVGKTATVYLKIPQQNQGAGKVTVEIQNRTVEARAVTTGAELNTGAKVQVIAIVAPDTLEVASV